MKKLLCSLSVGLLCIVGASVAFAQDTTLPRSTPEAEGVRSSGILHFINAADQEVDSIHSLMVVRHGKVVVEAWWEPESAEKQHILWSLSKSFTSTAIGLAVAEGHIDINDKVLNFFPELTPKEPPYNLKEMRVRDLLTMSTGHQDELKMREVEGSITKEFLNHPVPHIPGTHFKYNTPASYMLSAIVQKVTGKTMLEYLKPRLFDPLGIENPRWESSDEGISLGGYGLFVRTEDIAKFGQLYLQKGMWNGKQLLPASWVEMATAKQVSNGSNPGNDWNQGYGFQFWRCRHGAYRGDGKDGQFCIVLPKQDAVIAITSNTRDMGGELRLVWEHLLPAFADVSLPNNPKGLDELKSAIADLKASR